MSVTKNRISVMIDPLVLNQAKEAFQTLNSLLPFLIGLNTEERVSLPKINGANKLFVSDALSAVQNNATLFPPYVSAVELNKDLTLYNQLDELVTLSQQFTEKLRDTQILAGSEAFVSALTIYRLMEAASNAGLPGSDTIYEQLAERFAGQGKTAAIVDPSSN